MIQCSSGSVFQWRRMEGAPEDGMCDEYFVVVWGLWIWRASNVVKAVPEM